jgi:hypothetical protein
MFSVNSQVSRFFDTVSPMSVDSIRFALQPKNVVTALLVSSVAAGIFSVLLGGSGIFIGAVFTIAGFVTMATIQACKPKPKAEPKPNDRWSEASFYEVDSMNDYKSELYKQRSKPFRELIKYWNEFLDAATDLHAQVNIYCGCFSFKNKEEIQTFYKNINKKIDENPDIVLLRSNTNPSQQIFELMLDDDGEYYPNKEPVKLRELKKSIDLFIEKKKELIKIIESSFEEIE